jgi:hypothetical protein
MRRSLGRKPWSKALVESLGRKPWSKPWSLPRILRCRSLGYRAYILCKSALATSNDTSLICESRLLPANRCLNGLVRLFKSAFIPLTGPLSNLVSPVRKFTLWLTHGLRSQRSCCLNIFPHNPRHNRTYSYIEYLS